MMKKMTKTLSVVLALLMLCGIAAMASDITMVPEPRGGIAPNDLPQNSEIQPYDALPEPGTVFAAYEGIVTEIYPFYDTDGKVVEGKYFVFIETADGNPVSFYLDEDSVSLTGQLPEAGDSFIAYYDTGLPVIMIYPPRYTAVSYAVNLDKIEIIVEGQKLDCPAPYLKDFSLMVPVRAISEALGYKAEWLKAENAALINGNIRFELDGDSYTVDGGEPISLGVDSVTIGNRAFVPLSFFREVLGVNNAYFMEGSVVIDNGEKME